MRKEVLILEYQNVFDKIACRIIYQDEDILKRGYFDDQEIGVCSKYFPYFFNEADNSNSICYLNIRGIKKNYDNEIMIVSQKEAEIIKEKVKKINKKYGKKCRWRAREGEIYYYATSFLDVNSPIEGNISFDNIMYKNGNYFETEEQALEAVKRIKKVLNDYQNELKGEINGKDTKTNYF